MTKEEVLKKFEELGYEVLINEPFIEFTRGEFKLTISLDAEKYYYKYSVNNIVKILIRFTFEEHQLLTELLKAWGWFDEKES